MSLLVYGYVLVRLGIWMLSKWWHIIGLIYVWNVWFLGLTGGKSAILTALCVAFGCRAKGTQRASTLKDFIKTGCRFVSSEFLFLLFRINFVWGLFLHNKMKYIPLLIGSLNQCYKIWCGCWNGEGDWCSTFYHSFVTSLGFNKLKERL